MQIKNCLAKMGVYLETTFLTKSWRPAGCQKKRKKLADGNFFFFKNEKYGTQRAFWLPFGAPFFSGCLTLRGCPPPPPPLLVRNGRSCGHLKF